LIWNPRCINPRNVCIVPESLSNRRSANRTGRSRVISCHSRDIGVECLFFCNHYKDDGRGHVQYHDIKGYPQRLKVLATCREICKAVSLVTNRPEEWTYLPPLVIWFSHAPTCASTFRTAKRSTVM
jgi:hypothetical protein